MKNSKSTFKIIALVLGLIVAGYLGYLAYLYVVADASKRIKQNITKSINPLKLPGKILGFGDKE